jgi:hypothetical protein
VLAFTLALLGVGILAFRLALSRHIHVDEFHNVFSMQLVGSFGLPDYADPTELYHVIFAPVTQRFASTREMFFALRAIWGTLFVGLLVAVAWVQPFFPTLWGRTLVFIGVASWWPAWRHGFEVRHDLLLALGVVALYRVALEAESQPPLSARSALVAGGVAAWMQLDSHKAVTLWGPALLLIVALRMRKLLPRDAWRSASWLGAGLCGGLLSGLGLLFLGGALHAYFVQFAHFTRYAAGAERFSPLPLFGQMLSTGSALSVCAGLFLPFGVLQALRRRLPPHAVPTLAFLSFTGLALALNPVPYPYNLVWMTPALLFAGTAGAHLLLARARRFGLPLAGALLTFSVSQFARELLGDDYLKRSWDAQLKLVDAAEALTAPTDPIFDGVGMVCTRPPATRDWLIHSVFMPEYEQGHREQVGDVIERVAPPVLIGGHYRFNWLPEADLAVVAAHYLGLSNQLWVLAVETTRGEEQIHILRPGRYQVQKRTPNAELLQIDGRTVAPGDILSLQAGAHHVTGAALILWLGPTASELPTGLAVGGSLFAPAQLPGQ